MAQFKEITGHGEEKVAILVEGDRHDSVGRVERFLYAIAMMYIDINVENPRMMPQQFQNGQDNIIYITKTTRFKFLCMMQTSRPTTQKQYKQESRVNIKGARART